MMDKAEQRIELRASRTLLSGAELTTAAEGLLRIGTDFFAQLELAEERQAIAAYLPIDKEPDITPLLKQLYRQGWKIYLPICEPEYQLSWTLWDPAAELQRSAFSWVLEPAGERHSIEIMDTVGALLIPALALDGSGLRMGQGGGYYDRFLAALSSRQSAKPSSGTVPAAIRVGVVFAAELLPAGELAADELDQPVDYALTPEFFRALEC